MSGIGGEGLTDYQVSLKSGQKKSSRSTGRSGGFKDYGDGGEWCLQNYSLVNQNSILALFYPNQIKDQIDVTILLEYNI